MANLIQTRDSDDLLSQHESTSSWECHPIPTLRNSLIQPNLQSTGLADLFSVTGASWWDRAAAFDKAIRTVICTTNAIESLNARLRRAVNARGHFPTKLAAMKCLYMTIMSLDPTGKGRQRWSNRWKAALNAFEITFDGRLSAGRK